MGRILSAVGWREVFMLTGKFILAGAPLDEILPEDDATKRREAR